MRLLAILVIAQLAPLADAQDIDDWVHPNEVAGIEVYAGTVVPPQFQVGLKGCGRIVIWTE